MRASWDNVHSTLTPPLPPFFLFANWLPLHRFNREPSDVNKTNPTQPEAARVMTALGSSWLKWNALNSGINQGAARQFETERRGWPPQRPRQLASQRTKARLKMTLGPRTGRLRGRHPEEGPLARRPAAACCWCCCWGSASPRVSTRSQSLRTCGEWSTLSSILLY